MSKILWLDESKDPNIVGQLGVSLAKVQSVGARIAPGFIVPLEQKLEDGVSNEVLRAFDRLKTTNVVLRSSVNLADKETETIRDVKRNSLLDTISYMQANAHRRGRLVAIIVQKDIDAEVSGTVHSINPVTMDKKEILIEANLWMNPTVLSGESEPDMILLNKRTGMLSEESNGEAEICLAPEQIAELHRVVRKIEKVFETPVSVDWGYDHGVLYILNAREITKKTQEKFR